MSLTPPVIILKFFSGDYTDGIVAEQIQTIIGLVKVSEYLEKIVLASEQ